MLVGRSPFYNRSRTNMYERIVNEDPAFPPQMGADACDIIGLLLKKAPESRLAGGEIRAHPFFRDIDWELLRAKEVTPPINPEVGRASDCRYISSRYLTLEPRDTDEGDACARFSDFTFIGEDTYQRAVGCGGGHGGGRHGVGPHGGLLLHHPTPHAAQAGGDGRESYCTSGSDATPFSTGAYTTSSALTSSSKGSATGGGYEPSVEPAGVADPHHLVGNAHGHRHPYAHAHAHHAHAHAALYHHPQHPQAQQPQAQQPKAGGPDALASSYLPLHTAQAPPGAYAHHYHYPQQQPSRGMRRVHSGGSHSGHGGHEQQYGAHPGGGAYPPGPALAYPHMPMPPPPPPPPSHHDSASAVPAFPHPHHPHPPTALLPPPPLPLVPLPAPAAATAQPPSVVFSDASVGGDSGRSIVTSLTASLTVSGLEQRGAGGGGAGAASLAASVASSGGGTESSPPSPLP